jgi:hypothetical protein
MDRASQALAQSIPHGVRNTYRALAEHHDVARSTLHARAHGRRSNEEKAQSQQYLNPCEEKAVVNFVLHLAEFGQRVRIKHIPSLAFSVARQRSANKPPKPPGKNWARAFEKRHPELKAKRDRALDWDRYHIYDKVVHWFEVIGKARQDPTILPENVYNMDETGVMLSMPGSVKVLVGKNDMRGYRGARVKRTVVTAMECVSADGRYLNPMIVWPASTHRANWTTYPTPGWHYAYSESGYTDSVISLEWLKRIFDPETKPRAKGKPRMLIWDGFGTHETLEILEFCFENSIILCRLPSHTSHKLQPCDTAVFGPLKGAYRDQVDRLERGGVGTIGKQHFTYLYSPARTRALTERNILAGWRASGLYPLNPDKVLNDIPRPVPEPASPEPVTEPTIPTLKTYEINLGQQGEVLLTPVTPRGLTLLHNLIKQDADAEDEMSKQRLQKHLQKFANAAHTCFAERALQRDQIHFLKKINNEAKVRRATPSLVLGKAKVMSYEDLEEARAKRAMKDAAKAKGKGKRGRKAKVKSAVPETEEAIAGKENLSRKRKNPEPEAGPSEFRKTKVARMSEASEPARAPVARMI